MRIGRLEIRIAWCNCPPEDTITRESNNRHHVCPVHGFFTYTKLTTHRGYAPIKPSPTGPAVKASPVFYEPGMFTDASKPTPPPSGAGMRECGCPMDCACDPKGRWDCLFHERGHRSLARTAPRAEGE